MADGEKKLRLTFEFSDAIESQSIFNYANNFVAFTVVGLEFSSRQTRRDRPPPDEHLLQVYRFVRFQDSGGDGQIRIYLGKLVTPADVQVVGFDDAVLEVEIVKPLWKMSPEDGGPGDASEDPFASPDEAQPADDGDSGFIPDEPGESTPSEEESGEPPAESEEPVDGQPGAEPDPAMPEEADRPGLVADGEIYGVTNPEELLWDGPEPSTDGAGTTAQPVIELANGPAYTQFDLDKVMVPRLEIRGKSFNEALLELVADVRARVEAMA